MNKNKITPKHSINDEYLNTSPRRAKNHEMKRKHNFSVNIENHRDKKGVLSMIDKPISKALQDIHSTRLSQGKTSTNYSQDKYGTATKIMNSSQISQISSSGNRHLGHHHLQPLTESKGTPLNQNAIIA